MHKIIEPRALYFGTPVILISTLNEDGTPNLAPMSSAWWLGDNCMLGMGNRSKTVENIKREGQCVLNLPGPELVAHVNRLARATGKNPVPKYKIARGYEYVPQKFELAGLTPIPSDMVKPLRVAECPVQLEATVVAIHDFEGDHASAIEVKVVRVHVEEELIVPGTQHIDTNKWSPLIMAFCEYYGLTGKLRHSLLADMWFPELKVPN